jgi:hypothetical protein|tara:strand:+ start:14 stop:196 length:183 start_codon:yes stop_codon:yes gene_type:complete
MDEMNITSAQYVRDIDGNTTILKVVVSGREWHAPMKVGNRYYDEVLRQVKAGDLTIADAD